MNREDRFDSAAVRGRFAPSPTGYMHLGNMWSFLLCWLAVRAEGGDMVLRMEDIDPERSRSEYAEAVMDDLRWLGLDWDEGPDVGGPYGPYTQSERLEHYRETVERLLCESRAYPCYCTRKELRSMASAPHAEDAGPIYPGLCRALNAAQRRAKEAEGRKPAVRLRCPEEAMEFTDLVHGPVRMTLCECGGDFAIRRSDGVFAYQLAVVLDDAAQHITRIVRGDDLLHCTPRQLVLYELLDAPAPLYAHVPLVHDHKGERLAKRHHSLELREIRRAGATPEQVVGYLARKAGLLERPAACRARELVGEFDFGRLPREGIRLEADPVSAVLRVR